MAHFIETNLKVNDRRFAFEAGRVQCVLDRIAADHAATGLAQIEEMGDLPQAVVRVKYRSGAMLRDVVDALDQRGWLD